jgi:hypothetical protein
MNRQVKKRKNRTRMNTDETDLHGSEKKEKKWSFLFFIYLIRVNPSRPCSSVFYLAVNSDGVLYAHDELVTESSAGFLMSLKNL